MEHELSGSLKWSTKEGLYCCSVHACASAAGEKFPAYIIFKERGGKLGPHVKAALTYPENIKVSASANGWMTYEELHHWIRGVWKESDERRLLILDNYRPYLGADTISLAESMHTDICYVPGGCTGNGCVHQRSFTKAFQEQWIWCHCIIACIIL